jgi:peroxiredoxin
MNGLWAFGMGLTWLAMLAGSWLAWQLLRQNGRMLLRLEALEERLNELEFGDVDVAQGLPVGSQAPAFELPDLAGERKSIEMYRGQPVLLIFFNPACGFCGEMTPKLAALTRPADTISHRMGGGKGGSVPLPLILTTGSAEENRQFFAEHNIHCPVLLQEDGEVAKAYDANGTPSGYLISAEGKIASELAMGAEALLALAVGKSEVRSLKSELERNLYSRAGGNGDGRESRFSSRSVERSKIKRDGLKAGTVAPEFHLPLLDGRGELSLVEFRGRRVLLVFSSPGCGPCNTLAPELEKFHHEHSELEVVMISKGEPQENRVKVKEHGLTFPVVLQQQWEISRHYAMFATPIAYLIDEKGIIAREVAVGKESIMDLMASAAKLASAGHSERKGALARGS